MILLKKNALHKTENINCVFGVLKFSFLTTSTTVAWVVVFGAKWTTQTVYSCVACSYVYHFIEWPLSYNIKY